MVSFADTPHYKLVPKTLDANLRFRREMIELGRTPEGAADLWKMCARDVLFYINTFCWIFEPREAAELPFITYEFQDETLLDLVASIGKRDVVIEKSRDMGASWMCITALEWLWHFHGRQTFLMLSRVQDLVDKPGDPKSLFWKFDFLREHQPKWLTPEVTRTKMHCENADTGASLDGDSTNEFAGVADRRRALLLDEFSKMENQPAIFAGTRDVTRCRIFNFTPQGCSNKAHEVAHNPNFHKITLHWSRHPDKAQGLYSVDDAGQVTLLDKTYWTPDKVASYEFQRRRPRNPKYAFRSPWYDGECRRASNDQEISQELDIDYLGSNWQVFEQWRIYHHTRLFAREPALTARVEVDAESLLADIVPDNHGHLRLWLQLLNGRPPADRSYVIGVDPATGTGASNSCLSILDRTTGEKVGEYTNPRIDPYVLATVAVGLCKLFNGAQLIWEANGPGRSFGNRVIELGYLHVFYRKDEFKVSSKPTDFPGWWSTDDTKKKLIDDYRHAVDCGEFTNHSREALAETLQYVVAENGTYYHAGSKGDDPTGARTNHGDRVIADALANRLLKDAAAPPLVPEQVVPVGSIAHRMREQAKAAREKEYVW